MTYRGTGWRDPAIKTWHARHGYAAPAAGMALPMVEYDHGEPVAVVNYVRRDMGLPHGHDVLAAFNAFGHLHSLAGTELPFITAQYDPSNWAMRLFGHNDSAQSLLDTDDWTMVTERHFAQQLFRLRGKQLPDMSRWPDVSWSTGPWPRFRDADDEYDHLADMEEMEWPCSDMSSRRRDYEPKGQAPWRVKVPCVDTDLAVVDRRRNRLALLVDYKAPGAKTGLGSKNMQALSSLYTDLSGQWVNIPSMVVKYDKLDDRVTFMVHCLNATASNMLAFVLGHYGADSEVLAQAVAGDGWTTLDKRLWLALLAEAKG